MDGPCVNLKLLNDLIKFLSVRDANHMQVLNFGTTGIRTLHNDFKASVKKLI